MLDPQILDEEQILLVFSWDWIVFDFDNLDSELKNKEDGFSICKELRVVRQTD